MDHPETVASNLQQLHWETICFPNWTLPTIMKTLALCYDAETPQLMHEQAERPNGFRQAAERLARSVADATANSPNEDTLRHEIENALERECLRLGITWTPYQLERTLRNQEGRIGFADVVHGAIIIEYEPSGSFRGRSGPELDHAKEQAEDYSGRMAGRSPSTSSSRGMARTFPLVTKMSNARTGSV
jgi:hypothetical protein